MLPPRRCSRGAFCVVAAACHSLLLRLGTPTISVRHTASNPAMPHASPTSAAPADPAAHHLPPPTAAKPRGNPNLGLAPRRPHPRWLPLPLPRDPRQTTRSHARRAQPRPAHAREPAPAEAGGRIRVRDARTIHGDYGANARAANRFRLTLLRISRVDIALDRYQAHLPPAIAAGLCGYPPELMPPLRPRGAITAAEDRAMRHAVAASLAPWRAAHTNASSSRRAASAEIRAAS